MAHRSWQTTWGLVIAAAITFLPRAIAAGLLHNIGNDIQTYVEMGTAVLRGDNIYAMRVLFPYFPFSQTFHGLIYWISLETGMRFDLVVKTSLILADCLVGCGIYRLLLQQGEGQRWALAWTAVWAFNPVSILISSFHGNVMSIVVALCFGAYYFAESARRASEGRSLMLALSALCLGYAIGFRTFPVLFLPPYLILVCRRPREFICYTAIALLPAMLSAVPYLWYAHKTFLAEVLGYNGFSDFGFLSVYRALSYLTTAPIIFHYHERYFEISKMVYLVTLAVFYLPLFFSPRALFGSFVVLPGLLFYAIFAGVSAQYLVWIIPVAVAQRRKFIFIFSLISAVAMLSFYTHFAPGILFGRLKPFWLPGQEATIINIVANGLLVSVTICWSVSMLFEAGRAVMRYGVDGFWPVPSASWVRGLFVLAYSCLVTACFCLWVWTYAMPYEQYKAFQEQFRQRSFAPMG